MHVELGNTYNLNELTCCSLKGRKSLILETPGFYVGKVGDFNDLVNFWNLRAGGSEIIFFDDDYKNNLSFLKSAHIDRIKKSPLSTDRQKFTIGLWVQNFPEDPKDFESFLTPLQKEFGEKLTIFKPHNHPWESFNAISPVWYFDNQSILGTLSEKHTLSFQLPDNLIGRESQQDEQSFIFILTIKVLGNIEDDEETFNIPHIPELNNFYGQHMAGHRKLRVMPDGIALFISNTDRIIHLSSINTYKMIEAIFKKIDLKVSRSEPGIKALRIIKQFGELLDCRVFKVRGIRRLIKKFSPTTPFSKKWLQSFYKYLLKTNE